VFLLLGLHGGLILVLWLKKTVIKQTPPLRFFTHVHRTWTLSLGAVDRILGRFPVLKSIPPYVFSQRSFFSSVTRCDFIPSLPGYFHNEHTNNLPYIISFEYNKKT
jgi:hypothetical protein